MNDQIIEPSEILVEEEKRFRSSPMSVNPWIRCIARFFDYSIFFVFLIFLKKLFSFETAFSSYERLVPFEFFLWIPVEATLLSLFKTTPGKFLLKTELKIGKKKHFEFSMALKRSFAVWFRGIGMGIFGLNFLCMLFAYQKLKITRKTSWDLDDHVEVIHHPIPKWRFYLAVFIAVAGQLYYTQEKTSESKYGARSVRSVDEYSSSQIFSTRCDLLSKIDCDSRGN